jgi:hypothetical protein
MHCAHCLLCLPCLPRPCLLLCLLLCLLVLARAERARGGLRRDAPTTVHPTGMVVASDSMLASRRPLLESNLARYSPGNPLHGKLVKDRGQLLPAPPTPFSAMTPEMASAGPSSVGGDDSFPIGNPLSVNPEPLTATPPQGVPFLGGVSDQDEAALTDTSPPAWGGRAPSEAARRRR